MQSASDFIQNLYYRTKNDIIPKNFQKNKKSKVTKNPLAVAQDVKGKNVTSKRFLTWQIFERKSHTYSSADCTRVAYQKRYYFCLNIVLFLLLLSSSTLILFRFIFIFIFIFFLFLFSLECIYSFILTVSGNRMDCKANENETEERKKGKANAKTENGKPHIIKMSNV